MGFWFGSSEPILVKLVSAFNNSKPIPNSTSSSFFSVSETEHDVSETVFSFCFQAICALSFLSTIRMTTVCVSSIFITISLRETITRASSTSPPHRPYEDHRHGSDLNHSGAPPPPRGREFSGIRESSGRYIDYSPPRHVRSGAGGRRFGTV
ncbi:hypothetical protein YC2023_032290 [Brassica napus]